MKNKKPLTERQAEVLEIIKALIKAKGIPPTISEIAEADGVTLNAAHGHIEALKKKEWITREAKVSRGIRVL